MRFDKEQKKTGHNKHGHYLFGSHTCQFCKNDKTERVDFVGGEKVPKGKLGLHCSACNGNMVVDTSK